MAKKSKKEILRSYDKAKYYRLEFMLRNKEYVLEHEKLCDMLRNYDDDFMHVYKTSNKKKKAIYKKYTKMLNVIKGFANKWGLVYYPYPDYPGPDDSIELLESTGHIHDIYTYTTEPDFEYINYWAEDEFTTKDNFAKIEDYENWKATYKPLPLNRLKIEIKLDRPKEKIMYEINTIVTAMKKARKRKGLNDLKKCSFKIYEDYLYIYDLRTEKKWTFSRIAQKLYPKEFKKEIKLVESVGKDASKKERIYYNELQATGDTGLAYKKAYGNGDLSKCTNSVIQLVIDRFRAAELLVKGAYKDIW